MQALPSLVTSQRAPMVKSHCQVKDTQLDPLRALAATFDDDSAPAIARACDKAAVGAQDSNTWPELVRAIAEQPRWSQGIAAALEAKPKVESNNSYFFFQDLLKGTALWKALTQGVPGHSKNTAASVAWKALDNNLKSQICDAWRAEAKRTS